MPLWKITLSYDGTWFHGWQVQPGLPTIQGTLAEAIRHITGEVVLPQGSGRTDAGVHALGQVASAHLESPIPGPNLWRALNRQLPGSIRILSLEMAEPSFHARHSAVRKTYQYRIFPSSVNAPGGGLEGTASGAADVDRICPPTLAPYVWDCRLRLDLHLLNRAAASIVGPHDFTSFAAAGSELPGPVAGEPPPAANGSLDEHRPALPTPLRLIHSSSWSWVDDLLVYRVTGSGFLHHMVRNLVGTFVQIGAGRSPADGMPAILAARSRSAAGPTAPARGLFLVDVEYR